MGMNPAGYINHTLLQLRRQQQQDRMGRRPVRGSCCDRRHTNNICKTKAQTTHDSRLEGHLSKIYTYTKTV